MNRVETLDDYYRSKVPVTEEIDFPTNTGINNLKVFPRSAYSGKSPFRPRNFYKVSLIIGKGIFCQADSTFEVDKPALLISNPMIPFSWDATSNIQTGWHCIFTTAFLQPGNTSPFMQSPLFQPHSASAYYVDRKLEKDLSFIFMKMSEEMKSQYLYKSDVIRNYLQLLIHEAIKMQPMIGLQKKANAAIHITRLFLEMLEKQFPVQIPEQSLTLRTAEDFARILSVHVNHLNRSLKSVTGKTTSELISSRVVKESVALLRYSDWNVGQIADALGFEYSTNFNIFFKRHIGKSPSGFRKSII